MTALIEGHASVDMMERRNNLLAIRLAVWGSTEDVGRAVRHEGGPIDDETASAARALGLKVAGAEDIR